MLRSARAALALVALVAGAGLLVTDATAVLTDAPAPGTPIELGDDDSAAALFEASGMAPGHPLASCIAINHRADVPSALRLYGTSVGNGLDRALRLTIEEGTGGRFGDCTGFSGTPVYVGTLASFAANHVDYTTGVPLGIGPAYRFVVEVLSDDAAQGRDAEAAFTWEAQEVPPTPTTTTTVPATTTTTGPEEPVPSTTATTTAASPVTTPPSEDEAQPARPGSPTTAPGAGVDQRPSGATTTTAPEADPVPAPGTAPSSSGGGPTAAAGSPGRALLRPAASEPDDFAEQVAEVARNVAEKGSLPGALLAIAGAFLLVQDRIDRNDPKLALAPLYPDPDLSFDGDPEP